ncbi:MAG: hypothetical protein V1830_00605 [Candidatus Omnitrophota bacterium]
MPNCDKRGIILFIVIGIIMVVVILSTVILRVTTVHARLTHHQVTRIQAQYAAKAGILLALDKLRKNDAAWIPALPNGSVVKNMCQKVAAATSECNCSAPDITESSLPNSINCVKITVYGPAAAAPNQGLEGSQKVTASAVYTYTP